MVVQNNIFAPKEREEGKFSVHPSIKSNNTHTYVIRE